MRRITLFVQRAYRVSSDGRAGASESDRSSGFGFVYGGDGPRRFAQRRVEQLRGNLRRGAELSPVPEALLVFRERRYRAALRFALPEVQVFKHSVELAAHHDNTGSESANIGFQIGRCYSSTRAFASYSIAPTTLPSVSRNQIR